MTTTPHRIEIPLFPGGKHSVFNPSAIPVTLRVDNVLLDVPPGITRIVE